MKTAGLDEVSKIAQGFHPACSLASAVEKGIVLSLGTSLNLLTYEFNSILFVFI